MAALPITLSLPLVPTSPRNNTTPKHSVGRVTLKSTCSPSRSACACPLPPPAPPLFLLPTAAARPLVEEGLRALVSVL